MVFDVAEKLTDFIDKGADWFDILTIYYSNFFIYFGFQFIFMINFISVIWFTSKIAQNTEIIPILSTGVSFNRFLRPYFISSTILVVLTLLVYNYVLPPSNKARLEFEEQFYRDKINLQNGKIQFENGLIVSYDRYSGKEDKLIALRIEQWDGEKLVYILNANTATGDSITHNWTLTDYNIRHFGKKDDQFVLGSSTDTILPFKISDMIFRENIVEAMNISELNDFIKIEEAKNSKLVPMYLLAKHNRFAAPFAIYILTLIGVSVASKKTRGGTGANIAIGILICVVYIFAMKMTTVAALNVGFPPFAAVWIPNIIFLAIAILLYKRSSK